MAERPVRRRSFLAAAFAMIVGGASAYQVRATFRFETERHTLTLPGLARPRRIAFAADLHYGPWIRSGSVDAWVDAILAEAPDLVVLGGDLVDQAVGDDRAPLLASLARLSAPEGVFSVWGNHDHHGVRDLDRFRRELEEVGIGSLVNAWLPVGDDLVVAGIDDLREGRPDLASALAGRPAGTATILASHNPDVLPGLPGDVHLTLAGHTHGGQICLPDGTPIVTSSRYGRRFASGWVRAPALGYVTRGLGVGWVPLRVACPAELTILDVRPAA